MALTIATIPIRSEAQDCVNEVRECERVVIAQDEVIAGQEQKIDLLTTQNGYLKTGLMNFSQAYKAEREKSQQWYHDPIIMMTLGAFIGGIVVIQVRK